MILKAFKYRIYPNKEQRILLHKHFGCARFLYNHGLEIKIKSYKETGKSPSCNDLIKTLPEHKKKLPWLKEVYSQSLQSVYRNLDSAFKMFFNKVNQFPKFKKKSDKQSYQIPQNTRVNFHNKTTYLPKVGEVKTEFSREFEGNIKTVTVSKTPTNKYFISVLVEVLQDIPDKPLVTEDTAVGVDLNTGDLIVVSDGHKVENPKYLKKNIGRLKVLQRKASKKKKGSKNRKKANLKVGKLHEKIKNSRNDCLHKESTKLVRENQTICLEDLNVSGMVKNHCLAQTISDCGWSMFVTFLEYKAEWYGSNIIKIGRFDPSSKKCSCCGCIYKELILAERFWICSNCGITHDRDINAAINIKYFGLLKYYTGQDMPGELVEMPVSKSGSVKQESTPL